MIGNGNYKRSATGRLTTNILIGGFLIMKRSILAVLLLTFALSSPAFSGTTFVTIGTGSTGGTYYPVGAGFAKIWTKYVPDMKADAQSTGGTVHNIQLMEKKEIQAATMDNNYYNAYNGLLKYKGHEHKYLRGMLYLPRTSTDNGRQRKRQ